MYTTNFRQWITSVSGTLGFILIIVQLAEFIGSPSPRLSVTAEESVNQLPVLFTKFCDINFFDNLADSIICYRLDALKMQKRKISGIINPGKAESILNDSLLKVNKLSIVRIVGTDQLKMATTATKTISITIENNGKKTAEKINIDIPGQGFFTTVGPGNCEKEGLYKSTIQIPDLRAGNRIILNIWPYSDIDMKGIKLTWSDGLVRPNIIYKNTGFIASLNKHISPLLIVLLFASASIGLFELTRLLVKKIL